MSRKSKIWLMIAAVMLMGCIIVGGSMMVSKYETNDYEVNQEYKNISVTTNTADIVFDCSENAETSIVCYEHKNMKHAVSVKDSTLVIDVTDTRKWYERIGIVFDTPKITVYIPQGEYGLLSVKSSTGDVEIPKEFKFERMDISESTGNVTVHASVSDVLKVKTSTGNIGVENISAGALDITVSTGRISVSDVACEGDVKINVSTGKTYLNNLACKNLTSNGDTGDISLNHVIATETLSIERSTGDVKFDRSDAGEIFVETDTGDVAGSLLTDKIFITHTDTGRVDVPESVTGGKCKISTDTGDIKLEIL